MASFQMPALSQCKGPSHQAPDICYDHNDLVTIKVKQEDKCEEFQLSRGLLTWHSSYFAARLDPDGGFMDSGDPAISIEDNIEVFKAFRCWAYTNRLLNPPTNTNAGSTNIGDKYLGYRTLFNLWIFGEYYGIPGIQNAAIDMLHERTVVRWTLFSKSIKHVYENTEENSMLRKFCVHVFAHLCPLSKMVSASTRSQFAHHYSPDFIWDLLKVHDCEGPQVSRKAYAETDRCQWHNHSGPGGKLRISHSEFP